jgi:hypothetical protein
VTFLTKAKKMGIIPLVKLVADSRGRLTCAEIFTPGTAYDVKKLPNGTIQAVELVEKEVPVVRMVKTKNGLKLFPKKVSREAILAAIRKDREEQ